MDLSYRVQFHGWQTLFVPDVVVPAEIPEDVGAFKNQQFRWAKGSIQTALKLLPGIFVSKESTFKKVEAFFHLTHYLVHPLMVIMAILALAGAHDAAVFTQSLGGVCRHRHFAGTGHGSPEHSCIWSSQRASYGKPTGGAGWSSSLFWWRWGSALPFPTRERFWKP
jgi:hypothetical protein